MVMRFTGMNRDTPKWFSSRGHRKPSRRSEPIKDDQLRLADDPHRTRAEAVGRTEGTGPHAQHRARWRRGSGRCATVDADNALRLRSTEVPEMDGLS